MWPVACLTWDMKFYLTTRKIIGYATGWKVRGSNRGIGRGFLSSPKLDRLRGLPICTEDSFLGLKRQGFDVDQSPTSIAEVQNECSYTSTPPIS